MGHGRRFPLLAASIVLGWISMLAGCTSDPSRAIHVVAGTYGDNCRATHANDTARLAAACDGKVTCDYKVDVKAIGDTAPSCEKDYVAEWKCGESPAVKQAKHAGEAGYGSIVTLRCDDAQ